MKISIAMCTYNGSAHLREQLESIATQTRPPDELVVCDDGSSDGSIEIINSFARSSKFPVRIRVNENNLGSTRNFDQALGLCEGDIIAFSDQDDVWLASKLEQLEERLEKDAGLAFTDGELVDDSLKPLGRSVWQALRFAEKERALFAGGSGFEVLLDHNVVSGPAMAFHARFKPLLQPIPDRLVHDGVPVLHDWWSALLIAAVSNLSFIDEPLFKYRQHAQQQLGVRPINNPAAQPGVLDSRLASLQTELSYLSTILERLSERPDFHAHAGVTDRLQSHIAHLETRSSLPRGRARRIAPVARELFSRRYHRYSNGLYSAAKDMLVSA
jgi:hypothetical protein